jgi:hypothetical protein
MPTYTIVDIIAEFIRTTDGDNRMPADTLGWKIAEHLTATGRPIPPAAVSNYVRIANPTKQLGAARLAELITDRFGITY